MKYYWVYLLLCRDGTYYTGVTNNVSRRIAEHEAGKNSDSYTATRRPIRLMYAHPFDDIREAIRWEKILKDWSRKKKEALIRNDHELIALLSASKKSPGNGSRSARTDRKREAQADKKMLKLSGSRLE